MKLLAAALTACLLTAQQTTSPVSPEKLPNTAPAPQPTSERPKGWLDQTTMTGDWDGKRTTLDSWGIDLRAHLLTESAANPVGGKIQAACYTQQVDFGADIDLGRLIGLSGGGIQITLTDRVGRSLTADAIGNEFAVQELYGAGQNFRLAELKYQQDLLGNKITLVPTPF